MAPGSSSQIIEMCCHLRYAGQRDLSPDSHPVVGGVRSVNSVRAELTLGRGSRSTSVRGARSAVPTRWSASYFPLPVRSRSTCSTTSLARMIPSVRTGTPAMRSASAVHLLQLRVRS